MPQIIEENKKPSFLDSLGLGAANAGQAYGQMQTQKLIGQQQKREQERLYNEENEAANKLGVNLSGIRDPKMRQEAVKNALEMQGLPERYKAQYEAKAKAELDQLKSLGLSNEFNNQGTYNDITQEIPERIPKGILKPEFENVSLEKKQKQSSDLTLIPQNKIDAMSLVKPALARSWQSRNDNVIKQQIQKENFDQRQEENAAKAQRAIDNDTRNRFESDRDFNTKFSLPVIQDVIQDAKNLPVKEAALNNMMDAIQRGDDVGFMSPDWWADFTGIKAFRTMTGAQLENASKEFLMSSVGQAGSRPNQWIEQRILSMAPEIGKTKLANETYAQGLRQELDLRKAYINEVQRLNQEDFEKYGYPKADIAIRAQRNIEPYVRERQSIAKYRMQDIYEREKGIKTVKDLHTVVQGTPLTRRVKDILKKEFGANALEAAKRLGYEITPRGFAEKAEAQ